MQRNPEIATFREGLSLCGRNLPWLCIGRAVQAFTCNITSHHDNDIRYDVNKGVGMRFGKL